MNVINQIVEDFWDENRNYVESVMFIPRVRAEAGEIDSKSDRVVFITSIMARLSVELEQHGVCGNPHCTVESSYNKALYFLRQELSRLDVVVDHDPFSSVERDAVFGKLDDILNELAQIKTGQGIVAQDVEDLKNHLYLGRKKWKRLCTGTIADWVGSGIISEAVSKPLLEEMSKMLNELPALT